MTDENETLARNIQQSLLGLLNIYLPKNLLEKTKSNQTVKILSIGCGRFREAKSLFNYFSPHENLLRLYGIEIDNELLGLAKNDPLIQEKKEQVFLKKADAAEYENYKEWISDGLFDLIIVRHPEITFNTDIFIKIFSHCPNLLLKDGYLMVTTHFENEKEMLKLLFKLNKLDCFLEEENQNSPTLEIKGEIRYSDKYLLLARK